MKNYYRVMLGRGSSHFTECFDGNFIGTDFDVHVDLTNRLPEEWRKFNKEFIPIFLENRPEKSKVSAGLACGALWTVSKGIKSGDRVLARMATDAIASAKSAANTTTHRIKSCHTAAGWSGWKH